MQDATLQSICYTLIEFTLLHPGLLPCHRGPLATVFCHPALTGDLPVPASFNHQKVFRSGAHPLLHHHKVSTGFLKVVRQPTPFSGLQSN